MKKSIFVTAVLSLVLCLGFSSLTFSAAKEPIKIGWLCPLTGQWAEIGKDMTNGFNMYMEEIGYKVAGREIVVVREDTRAIGCVAARKRSIVPTDCRTSLVGARPFFSSSWSFLMASSLFLRASSPIFSNSSSSFRISSSFSL